MSTLALDPILVLDDAVFMRLCQKNPHLKLERNARGELVIMESKGGESGIYNAEINADSVIWNRRTKSGKIFDSSTCFKLPDGSLRSPDLAWIRLDRWEQLTPQEKRGFPPICPDFVLELQSRTDSRQELQAKMRNYIENGVRLGWLIDPQAREVEIYRPGREVECLSDPAQVLGEDVLVGFVLDLQAIW